MQISFRLVLFMMGCAVAAGCGAPEPPPVTDRSFRNVEANAAEYVGTGACTACHEDEAAGFSEHGMARSMAVLIPDRIHETYPGPWIEDDRTGLRYRAVLQDGLPLQEEVWTDPDGSVDHRLTRRMDIIMGSGNAARTYFTLRDGWLFQLPLTWYTQEGRWDFSPGYDQANGRFDRTLPDRCMACHNGRPVPVPQTNGRYESFPQGITCESCHGPGSLHVSERLAVPEPDGDVDDSIVNPAHLPFERRFDICQQCHLNGTVSMLRSGRTAYDFRPGDDLSEHLSVFVAAAPEGNGEIGVISHAERLAASACFAETPGGLDCTTCHDPHAARPKPDVFGMTCMTCHDASTLPAGPDHGTTGGCTGCHMPRVDAEEAPHSSFTDHYIRVVGTREEDAGRDIDDTPDGLEPYFDRDRGEAGAEYRGMARVVLGRQRAAPDLIRLGADLLGSLFPAVSGEGSFLLGLARLDTGDLEGAVAPLEAAVTDDPDRAERLNALAQAYQLTSRPDANTERLYRRALQIQPARGDIRINYGQFLESRDRTDEAIEQYRLAGSEEPWQALAHFNLGTAFLRRGDPAAGREELWRAIHLDPRNVEAWGNLGGSHAQEGRIDSARTAFEAAVRIAPSSPLALGNLGALYVNLDDLERAIPLLLEAVTLDPGYVDALTNLALAYVRVDSTDLALQTAQRVTAIDSDNALARQIIAATQ